MKSHSPLSKLTNIQLLFYKYDTCKSPAYFDVATWRWTADNIESEELLAVGSKHGPVWSTVQEQLCDNQSWC